MSPSVILKVCLAVLISLLGSRAWAQDLMPVEKPPQKVPVLSISGLQRVIQESQEKKGQQEDETKKQDSESKLLKSYSGQQQQGPEELPRQKKGPVGSGVPRGNESKRIEINPQSIRLDQNGNPLRFEGNPGETVDMSGTEIIRQRYPDGKIQVMRSVMQDEEGNYFNHGPWRLFNKQSQVLAEGQFVKGYMEGSWQRWHNPTKDSMFASKPFSDYTGPFLSVAFFKEGKLDGTWGVLDPQRRKIFELGYRNGKRNGTALWWFPNGMKMRQMGFKDGVLHGELVEWDQQGKIVRRERFVDGKQVIVKRTEWSRNQRKSEEFFLGPTMEVKGTDDWWNAKPAGYSKTGSQIQHGSVLQWYQNGQPKKRGRFDKGSRTGTFVWWYSNGQKKASGAFANDERTGNWVFWHENGMKSIAGAYKEGKPIGKWRWWDKEGKLVREADVEEFPEEIEYDLPDPDHDVVSEKEKSILSGSK